MKIVLEGSATDDGPVGPARTRPARLPSDGRERYVGRIPPGGGRQEWGSGQGSAGREMSSFGGAGMAVWLQTQTMEIGTETVEQALVGSVEHGPPTWVIVGPAYAA